MPSSTVKTPTARSVSALLAKAGFEKSVSSPSRIRGWRNWSPGYLVNTTLDYKVRVKHMTFSRFGDEDQKRRMLYRYAEAIRTARPGWTVTEPEPEPEASLELIVTAPAPSE